MQVLFRAKDIETGEWRYGWYNQWYDDETYMRYHHISLDNGSEYRIDPSTLGQYTNLDDKEGNKIFEGDIVDQGKKHPGEVRFYDGAFHSWHTHCSTPLCHYETTLLKITGNIHDN